MVYVPMCIRTRPRAPRRPVPYMTKSSPPDVEATGRCVVRHPCWALQVESGNKFPWLSVAYPLTAPEPGSKYRPGADEAIRTGWNRVRPPGGCTTTVPVPGAAESGIAASTKSGPAVVISTGRVRPAPSCTDMRTPLSVGTGAGENSETFVRVKVSRRNTLPGATVPRTRLAPFRTALGKITGGPKSNWAGAAKL